MIVVDAGAVVDALANVSDAGPLRRLLADQDLHAPALLDYEVVSVVRGLTTGGRLSGHRAEELLADFDDLPIERWPCVDSLRRRAFELRENVSAYDAAYVALAEALGCRLVTRDRRLARSSGHRATMELR